MTNQRTQMHVDTSQNFTYRSQCELCQSERNRILVSQEFTKEPILGFLEDYYETKVDSLALQGGSYEIAECLRCGFMWQTQILNEKLMSILYDQWISAEKSLEKKTCAEVTLYWKLAIQVRGISLLLGKKPCDTAVLDFGMGWGFWCMMARAFGYKVAGIEVSQERIEFASANGIKVINLDCLKRRQFDFINAEQVFEHIPNPLETLRDLSNCLTPEGVIRIAVPNAASAGKPLGSSDWKPSNDAFHPLEHINCFTAKTLTKLGELADLKPIYNPYRSQAHKRPLKLLKALPIGRLKTRFQGTTGTEQYFAKATQ